MNTPDKPKFSKHPEERLLLYLENRLAPDLRHQMEEHVRECPLCAAELEKLDFTIASLKACQEVFCPDPWELYEFVDSGEDPGGRIARHLERCSLCREEISLYEGTDKCAETRKSVLRAFEENFPAEPVQEGARVPLRRLSGIVNLVLNALRNPAAALACAAAAVLIVVLAYPREETVPVMALSPVTWTEPGAGPASEKPRIDLRLMGPSPTVPPREKAKPRLATLLFLKGLPQPLPQESIDDLYRALKPSGPVVRRYTMISPSRVRAAMLTHAGKTELPRIELLKVMGAQLGTDEALLLTVTAEGNRFKIEGELARTSDGEMLRNTTKTDVLTGELATMLREAASGLLTENEKPSRTSP